VPFELQKHKRSAQEKKGKERKGNWQVQKDPKEEKPCVLEENRYRLMAVQLPQYSVLVYPAMR